MKNDFDATESDHWSTETFYQVTELPALKKGGKWLFFLEVEKMPFFQDACFPFTLPREDPNSLRPTESIRWGCLGDPDPADVMALLTSSTLSLISWDGVERQESKVQYAGPGCTFPSLFSLHPNAQSRKRPLLAPYREILTPDFRIFHIYLDIAEGQPTSAPLLVSIVLDAYIRKRKE